MKMKPVGNCRIAVRTEGPYVMIYLADLRTMDDAKELARFHKGLLVEDAPLREAIFGLFSLWLQRQVREATGVEPTMIEGIPPEPPEGHA